MKQTPILFSTPMVQAIKLDRKTQTRRIVRMHKEEPLTNVDWGFTIFTPPGHISLRANHANGEYGESFVKLQYGKRGDQLWIKESFFAYGLWVREAKGWTFHDSTLQIGETYRYFEESPNQHVVDQRGNIGWHRRPSIFMPRHASRFDLEILTVRVERLNDISEEDAMAEGIVSFGTGTHYFAGAPHKIKGTPTAWPTAKEAFASMWDKINGKRAPWASNPFVWCISFQRIDVKMAAAESAPPSPVKDPK